MSAFERLGIAGSPAGGQTAKGCSEAQRQTEQTFAFKWGRRETYESPDVHAFSRKWLFERYCDNDPDLLAGYLAGGSKIILDAGCGSGYSAILFFGDHLKRHDYLGVDISNSVDVARQRFAEHGYPGDFLQASLMDLPIPNASVDMVFAEGVLHHTDSTELAIRYLSTKIKPGGLFLFYVYAKKAVIREFTDDFIREKIRDMSDEEAWEALMPLTELGEALGKLKVEIDVPRDIPCLGIKKGKMDLQRLFYWNICKLFYRPDFALDEMHHINFDWFRPLNCHRHTKEEIISYCDASGLTIERMNVQPAGFTVVTRKR